MDDAPAYGLWPLVIINSLIFILFGFSFAKPQTSLAVLLSMSGSALAVGGAGAASTPAGSSAGSS